MRYPVLLSAVFAVTAAPFAQAQEAPNSHTLNEQMQRVQQGQAPIPAPWARKPVNAPVGAPVATATTTTTQTATTPTGLSPQTGHIDSVGSGAIPALPLAVQSYNGANYLTGGIGDEELAQLKAREHDFNVHLLFVQTGGEYIGGASVRIADGAGNVIFSADNAGPYLYANLKPGKYMVAIGTNEGLSKKSAITVPATGGVKAAFRF